MTAKLSGRHSRQSPMRELSLMEIANIVGGSIVSGLALTGAPFKGAYAFDSRILRPGDLFFALKGETRDGREFVRDAQARGAAAAVVSEAVEDLPADFVQIAVDSPLRALQACSDWLQPVRCREDPLKRVTTSIGSRRAPDAARHQPSRVHWSFDSRRGRGDIEAPRRRR